MNGADKAGGWPVRSPSCAVDECVVARRRVDCPTHRRARAAAFETVSRELRGPRRRPMFCTESCTDSGPRAGPLFHETQAYLRRPAKPWAVPVKLDGLRFGASTIR